MGAGALTLGSEPLAQSPPPAALIQSAETGRLRLGGRARGARGDTHPGSVAFLAPRAGCTDGPQRGSRRQLARGAGRMGVGAGRGHGGHHLLAGRGGARGGPAVGTTPRAGRGGRGAGPQRWAPPRGRAAGAGRGGAAVLSQPPRPGRVRRRRGDRAPARSVGSAARPAPRLRSCARPALLASCRAPVLRRPPPRAPGRARGLRRRLAERRAGPGRR